MTIAVRVVDAVVDRYAAGILSLVVRHIGGFVWQNSPLRYLRVGYAVLLPLLNTSIHKPCCELLGSQVKWFWRFLSFCGCISCSLRLLFPACIESGENGDYVTRKKGPPISTSDAAAAAHNSLFAAPHARTHADPWRPPHRTDSIASRSDPCGHITRAPAVQSPCGV